MADEEKDIRLLKKTSISVYVDEALPDILVVTYEYGVKIFKGVLLDSTKRNLPCGINALNPAFKKTKTEDDPLYTVNQRFAYTDPALKKNKNVQIPSKYKNNKMTVRLRPRQVLCTKCKGICNENSENVVSRKRKTSENSMATPPPPPPSSKRASNAPVTRSVYNQLNNDQKKAQEPTLVPKLTRLTPQEELSALNGNIKVNEKNQIRVMDDMNDENLEVPGSETGIVAKIGKRVQRKKRSVGSMEDLWDESVFEEKQQNNNNTTEIPPLGTNVSTRTIKISYGPQGEGTVLKIPAQIDDENRLDERTPTMLTSTTTPNPAPNTTTTTTTTSSMDGEKAARRALKKAKKEAKRKVVMVKGSPLYVVGGSSPRYTVGSASPRHGLGNNSPRYVCGGFEMNVPKRRKHKVKHKKKHKDDKDRRHKDGEVSSTQDYPKEQCITQKLSINLKRLNNTYTSCPTSGTKTTDDPTSSSDEHSEVPDFPPPNPPLMLRINTQTVQSAPSADGGKLMVGDVVWGKIHGFPWWPGKILTITNCGTQGPQAHVAWYGSSTSSLMQCDQLNPYLETFKVRYNKKKKGPYKEAIKQATFEAKENAEIRVRQPLGNSPSHNIIAQVVPPALASPREIDVVS